MTSYNGSLSQGSSICSVFFFFNIHHLWWFLEYNSQDVIDQKLPILKIRLFWKKKNPRGKKWKLSFQLSIFRDFLRWWMASQALWIMWWLWIVGRQRDSGKLVVRWVYQYFSFSLCLSFLNWCPEELAWAHCCFSPDFSFNQVSKATLDGEKWIGWGKKIHESQNNLQFGNDLSCSIVNFAIKQEYFICLNDPWIVS